MVISETFTFSRNANGVRAGLRLAPFAPTPMAMGLNNSWKTASSNATGFCRGRVNMQHRVFRWLLVLVAERTIVGGRTVYTAHGHE
jgi:hypothetical protein